VFRLEGPRHDLKQLSGHLMTLGEAGAMIIINAVGLVSFKRSLWFCSSFKLTLEMKDDCADRSRHGRSSPPRRSSNECVRVCLEWLVLTTEHHCHIHEAEPTGDVSVDLRGG